jgi:protoheme IX farnesyltransferase
VWGGLAGGMPVLAGRVLGLGHIDFIGILLGLSVLFWIPTHMLTFSIRYKDDYQSANIPIFPSTYGEDVTRKTVAFSSIIAGLLISSAAIIIGIRQGYLHALGALSVVLIIFSFLVMIKPSNKLNFGLFKYASLYMLISMLLLSI